MSKLQSPDNYESLKCKLASAAIVGHTTSSTSKLWIRVYVGGYWQLVVSAEPLEDDVLEAGEFDAGRGHIIFNDKYNFTDSTDLTHCFQITGLKPDTRYFYYVVVDKSRTDVERRVELGGGHQYWFRTLPKSITSLVFGFYSCHDPFSVNPTSEGAWGQFNLVMEERKAHFTIGGGDQIYCDTNRKSRIEDVWEWLKKNKKDLLKAYTGSDGALNEAEIVEYFSKLYRTYYRIYWNFENVRSVFRRYPQYMIWDDHEIMDGWGSLTAAERKEKLSHLFQDDDHEANYQLVMLMFVAASRVYWEYQHCHNPDTNPNTKPVNLSQLETYQWDYNVDHGAFGLFAMDLRGHHDCESNGYHLLGPAQFQRFEAWINSDAVKKKKALFILSPVPMVHWNETFVNTADFGSLKDDFMDEWGHKTNHEERNQVLDLLLKRSHKSGQSIVILSGDVHCASAFRITNERYPKAKLFNVTSSAISRSPAPKLATSAIQKTAPIDSYPGGKFEQLYRFSGANNFALINADYRDGELSLSASLYWTWPGTDNVTHKVLLLDR